MWRMENLLFESMYRVGLSCLGSASLGAGGFFSGSSRGGASAFLEFLSLTLPPHSSSSPNLLANLSSERSAAKPVFVPYCVSAGYSRAVASALGPAVASPLRAVAVALAVAGPVAVATLASAAVAAGVFARAAVIAVFEPPRRRASARAVAAAVDGLGCGLRLFVVQAVGLLHLLLAAERAFRRVVRAGQGLAACVTPAHLCS